jgi:hypothetical protein
MSGAALVSGLVAAVGAQPSPVDQQYLFEARQMQALSLAVHIPLVCFGLAFPRRGDLHRDLRLRLGPAPTAAAPAVRHPGGDRGGHRLVLRHLGQRLDEPPQRVHAAGRPPGRRAAVVGAVRQPVPVARVRAHVLRRLHRRRVPGRQRLRVGVPAGTLGPLPADGADDRAHRRGGRGTAAGRGRRLGGTHGRAGAAGQAGRAGRARADDDGRAGAPARLVRRQRSSTGSRSHACCRCSPTTTPT